ncbi:MAG: SpoIIE family protein phosphatase [Oligosphaeraceae bacterium]|nr:SpoIIE family protein phosphatase [Oligosphaeraceae bacterium]
MQHQPQPAKMFIDLGFAQRCKHGENICGDAFKFVKTGEGSCLVAVLSDGLGSGVKANILSSMTSVMAMKFACQKPFSVLRAAETMMSALPICSVRKISYATFTILNASVSGEIRVIEMGNPPFLYFQGLAHQVLAGEELTSPRWQDRTMKQYTFQAEEGDRILFFSDGISQAGLGTVAYPLGWTEPDYCRYLSEVLEQQPDISSQQLCQLLTRQALSKESGGINLDDMTCACVYFRQRREMLLFTGPPYDARRDGECAAYLAAFPGDKVISGGTSADIVARELGREVNTDLQDINGVVPPQANMAGIDLVTEGVFTLTRAIAYLENFAGAPADNAAGRLVEILLRNDAIHFLVGTRVNEAHQDPNLPQELDIRRNIVGKLAEVLRNKYYKEVDIKYI